MNRLRLAAALAASVALALPAGAAAQEDQPQGGDGAPPLQGAPPRMSPVDRNPRAGQSPRPPADRQAGEAPQLPRTGADAGLVGLAGAGLLMMGFGLRLRLPGA